MLAPLSLGLGTIVPVDGVREGVLGGVVPLVAEDLADRVGVGMAESSMPQRFGAGRGSDGHRRLIAAFHTGLEPVEAIGVARGDCQALVSSRLGQRAGAVNERRTQVGLVEGADGDDVHP